MTGWVLAAGDYEEHSRSDSTSRVTQAVWLSPLPLSIQEPARKGTVNSPVLNQVVLEDLVNFGGGSGKAALYQRLQSIDMHQGFNPKVQRVPKLEGGKGTPVGFIKVFIFEDLKSEGEDALVATHYFQGRVL